MRSGHHISSQLPATDPPRRGPSFHALPASLFPVPPQKHASREQRLREKVSNTFLLEEGGPRRVLLPSFASPFLPIATTRPISVRTTFTHPTQLPAEGRNVVGMNPFLRVARGNEEEEGKEEKERGKEKDESSLATPRDNGE